jgi:hypothetical protein
MFQITSIILDTAINNVGSGYFRQRSDQRMSRNREIKSPGNFILSELMLCLPFVCAPPRLNKTFLNTRPTLRGSN